MKSIVVAMLALYKRWLSPALKPACRFVPTCSEYAMEAVERHGVLDGTLLATWRLLRCSPLANGGYDPVPVEPVASGTAPSADDVNQNCGFCQGTASIVP